MVRPHLKWLSLPLAFVMTLGAWAAPADAGVIPWVYNAIFGPARNGVYGGGAYYGPRYYGRTYARYGGFDGGCGYGGCGTPVYGYGASYGVPVYGGYDLGCGSCGTCGSYGGCSTGSCGGGGCGTCGSSYYAGGYGAPVYGYGTVGNCGVGGCGVVGSCAPNAVGVPQPVPQPGAYPAGAAPAVNPGFQAAPPGGATGVQPTYDPNGMNIPGGANRTSPGSGFPSSNPMGRTPTTDGGNSEFKAINPVPGESTGGGTSQANPAAPAKPASNGTKPPSILGDDDVNVGPVAREDKVARVTFERMRISASNRDARLVRIDPALPSAAVAVARK